MSESATPESGPLSREQAVEMLIERPEVEENNAPEAPLEAAEEPTIEAEASPAEDPDAEAENPAEEDEASEAEEPEKLDAPLYWKPEAKAVFAAMTPEQQAVVLAQEGPREEVTAKVKAEAAAQIERANKEVQGVQALAQQLNEFLPQAVQAFQQRWGEPDWVKVIQEHGSENAAILKAQYDQEQKLLSQTAQAAQEAETQAKHAYVQAEWKALAQLAPELAPDVSDPTKGAENRQATIKYLKTAGYDQSAIDQISARDMLIARKAMLFDQAQATLTAPKAPKPVAATVQRASVRPAATVTQAPLAQREQIRLQNRFAQTASRDDAVALILAKGL